MKIKFYILLIIMCFSCVSTKSTLQNVDSDQPLPIIKNNAFVITHYAEDAKYAFSENYPVNLGPIAEHQEKRFIDFFFNGIEGKNNAPLTYQKTDSCCPFPSKNEGMGAGFLSVYEVTNTVTKETKKMYFNIYERGKVLCPKGYVIKNDIK